MKPDEMLKTVVQTIVDYPDEVEVESSVHSGSIRLILRLNDRDRRKLEGHAAEDSLKTLLAAAGGKLNKRIFLEFR